MSLQTSKATHGAQSDSDSPLAALMANVQKQGQKLEHEACTVVKTQRSCQTNRRFRARAGGSSQKKVQVPKALAYLERFRDDLPSDMGIDALIEAINTRITHDGDVPAGFVCLKAAHYILHAADGRDHRHVRPRRRSRTPSSPTMDTNFNAMNIERKGSQLQEISGLEVPHLVANKLFSSVTNAVDPYVQAPESLLSEEFWKSHQASDTDEMTTSFDTPSLCDSCTPASPLQFDKYLAPFNFPQ